MCPSKPDLGDTGVVPPLSAVAIPTAGAGTPASSASSRRLSPGGRAGPDSSLRILRSTFASVSSSYGRRTGEIVVALSQVRVARLGEVAAAIGAPLTSVQRGMEGLVADGLVQTIPEGSGTPRYSLDDDHPAADALVEVHLRMLEVQHAMDLVLRANPAAEFGGRDDHGYLVVLSPFAELHEAARLDNAATRINRARAEAVGYELLERAELRDRLRDDETLRARGLAMTPVKGSRVRMFRDPFRHGSPDAAPLGRLHPSLPRIPLSLLRDLTARYRLARLTAFGSAVREDFREDSDVDVLFEAEEGVLLGARPQLEIQQRLELVLGHDVDLVNAAALTPVARAEARAHGMLLHGS